MKKILFYTENKWAFGSIHYGFCKELYQRGVYANLLDWSISYSPEEFKLLNETYDVFVTMPPAVMILLNNGIPANKIVAIAHAQWDILLGKERATFDFYPELKGFGVISNILKRKCKEWNISREPKVIELGIHTDLFYARPPKQLKKLGYASAAQVLNYFGQEIKRPQLVDRVVEGLNIEVVKHSNYNFMCMPGFYKTVDAIIVPSIEEAGGLPALEAAAAGRLVLSTPVGYFEKNGRCGGGIELPMNADDFIKNGKRHIQYYVDNAKDFENKCLEAQEYARSNYDWKYKIQDWLDLLL
jgi:glycosyltransferase involved in cell wall biosynthesis